MRNISTILLILSFSLCVNAQKQTDASSQSDTSIISITTQLTIPFGTIARLEVEVYDGDSLQMKECEGDYLLKVNSVNGKPVNDTLLLPFIDETEHLANDDFSLYKLTYGKTAKSLTGTQIDKMKKKYIGRRLILMAYETGHFTGMPDNYFKYQPIRADMNFHFEHYLIVVSILTK
jgi:hypothetical protein